MRRGSRDLSDELQRKIEQHVNQEINEAIKEWTKTNGSSRERAILRFLDEQNWRYTEEIDGLRARLARIQCADCEGTELEHKPKCERKDQLDEK